ncbi:MAG: aminotransferase class V-fold PLP-dependent enzyme [bacterium]
MNYTNNFAERKNLYFNSASSGVLTLNAVKEAKRYLDIMALCADVRIDEYFEILDKAREGAAGIIGAEKKSIGLISNTTTGIFIVRNTFPEIKNIVIYGHGFPCTLAPFLHDGRYRVEVVSKDMNLLNKMLSQINRSIVFVDLVDFLTGELIDIDELTEVVHNHNSIVAVDAIQGAGYLPLSMKDSPTDFLFAGTSKWLLGPQGAGFIYINEKHIEKSVFRNLGWLSLDYRDFDSFATLPEPRKDASGLESGTRNVIGAVMMKENLKFLNSVGIEEVYRHDLEGAEIIMKKAEMMGSVTQQSGSMNTPIVSLKTRNIHHLYNYLSEHNVQVSFRENYIRIAYHIFNTAEEAEKLVEILDQYKL